ncbi:hypothetical protein L7F22_004609 [Adiantum nelumboides]|nr:hypothetical protein [Adiantum nelumboides]
MMLLTGRRLLSTDVSKKARSYKNHPLELGKFVSFHTCLQIQGTEHVGISSHLSEKAIHQLSEIDGRGFNRHLSKGRVRNEHVFGLLKNRWRILKDINVDLQRVPKYIVACCVLHNILIESTQEEPCEEDYDPHPNLNNEVYNVTRSERTEG